jgi:hypothetical protein
MRSPDGIVKRCPGCKTLKSVLAFSPWALSKDGLKLYCRGCYVVRNKLRTGAYKARSIRFGQKNYGYNITVAAYENLVASQNGLCRICGKTREENGRELSIDHNHKTGKVRGLLCIQCNAGLGNYRDDPDLLRAAIKYLEEFDVD